jgi:hypothetical protein
MRSSGSVFLLVGAAFPQLVSGLFNVATWYPWSFFFPRAHYAVAWIAVGALLLQVAVKLPLIRQALGEPLEHARHGDGPTRRRTRGADSPTRKQATVVPMPRTFQTSSAPTAWT